MVNILKKTAIKCFRNIDNKIGNGNTIALKVMKETKMQIDMIFVKF
jgi:hypothetical protein